MDRMRKLYTEPLRYIPMRVGILTVIVSVILVLVFRGDSPKLVLGLIVGAFISVVQLFLIAMTGDRIVKMEEKQGVIYAQGQSLLRLAIAGVVLFIAAKYEIFNVFTVFLGLLFSKLVIQFEGLVHVFKTMGKKAGDSE